MLFPIQPEDPWKTVGVISLQNSVMISNLSVGEVSVQPQHKNDESREMLMHLDFLQQCQRCLNRFVRDVHFLLRLEFMVKETTNP